MSSNLDDALNRLGEDLRRRARRGVFSEGFLQEIRCTDMQTVVERYLGAPSLGKLVNCPFHDARSPSMRVYDDHAYCFACHWHGDQIKFVMQIESVDFRQAVICVAEISGLPLEFASIEERRRLAARRRELEETEMILAIHRQIYRMAMPHIFTEADELMHSLPRSYSHDFIVAMAQLECLWVTFEFGSRQRGCNGNPDPIPQQCEQWLMVRDAFDKLEDLVADAKRLVALDGLTEDGKPGGVPINHHPGPPRKDYHGLYCPVPDEIPEWYLEKQYMRDEQMLIEENWVTEDDEILDAGPRDTDEADAVLCRPAKRS